MKEGVKEYKSKPKSVQALYYNGHNIQELIDFMGDSYGTKNGKPVVKTLEGEYVLNKDYYIVKGIQGEFYPCDPDIFKQCYTAYPSTPN